MSKGIKVLCGASAYEKKYYLNEDFNGLPDDMKNQLKVICVLFTEDVGGALTICFNEENELEFRTMSDEGDLLYDEIGSVLKVKQIREQYKDLWEGLQTYFKVFFMGEE